MHQRKTLLETISLLLLNKTQITKHMNDEILFKTYNK